MAWLLDGVSRVGVLEKAKQRLQYFLQHVASKFRRELRMIQAIRRRESNRELCFLEQPPFC